MWTYKTKILFICYRVFASWLPISQRSHLAKKCRGFWAKKIITQCGENVNFERGAFFTPDLIVGDNSGVGINCELYGKVIIGKDVMMGPEVVVYTSGHTTDRKDIPMRLQGVTELKPVTIGNDVWIGRRVMIMPGVTIGNGCVIGAGAVVTHNVPDYCVVAGVPARIVKERR